MAARLSIQDALSAIRQRGVNAGTGSINVYQSSINADGSIQITRNGTPLPQKFWWNTNASGSSARTDANQGSNDTVTIEDPDGSNPRVGDFQTFLLSLT
jgi:hypothetical protein